MKVLVLIDTSGSMGFQGNDEVTLKELDTTGGATLQPSDDIGKGYDKVILITDELIGPIPENIEVWGVKPS